LKRFKIQDSREKRKEKRGINRCYGDEVELESVSVKKLRVLPRNELSGGYG